MQRIGRVNRIGSVSKHIYNYVFYPSRQGNREINLNQIALSKIQTFHSTFGEDNKIYSQNEVKDRNLSKLFDEAMKEQKKDLNQEFLIMKSYAHCIRPITRQRNTINSPRRTTSTATLLRLSPSHQFYPRALLAVTMGGTEGRYHASGCQSQKPLSVRTGVCNPTPRSWIR